MLLAHGSAAEISRDGIEARPSREHDGRASRLWKQTRKSIMAGPGGIAFAINLSVAETATATLPFVEHRRRSGKSPRVADFALRCFCSPRLYICGAAFTGATGIALAGACGQALVGAWAAGMAFTGAWAAGSALQGAWGAGQALVGAWAAGMALTGAWAAGRALHGAWGAGHALVGA
jgi:hypothetical protein